MKINKIVLILLILAPKVSIAEECVLEASIDYLPITYQDNSLPNEMILTLTKTNLSACEGRIGISSGNSVNYNRTLSNSIKNSTLSYGLFGQDTLVTELKDVPDAIGSSEYISFSFLEGQNLTKQISIYLKIDNNQQSQFLKPAGNYSDSITINFYPTTSVISYKSIPVSLQAEVQELIGVKVGPINQGYDSSESTALSELNYNEQSKQLSAYVISNVGYSVSFNSTNLGVLVKNGSNGISIPYSLIINGIPRTLTSTYTISSEFVTNSNGNEIPITIGTQILPSQQYTGTYSDTIIISIIAME